MDIAEVVRAERDRAALTQSELARRAGVSQPMISAIERGLRLPSQRIAGRLLSAMGLQLRLDTEPTELPLSDLDASIEAALARPMTDRLTGPWFDGTAVLRQLAPLDVVVEGAAAAILHGVPMTATAVDVAVERRRLDDLADLVREAHIERWSEVWRGWGAQGADPRTPGPMRWCTLDGEFRVRIADDAPDAVTVLLGDLPVAVRLLHEIETHDPRVRQALNRVRDRHG